LSIILCTQHKGGAGKTTLAVHLAGILATKINRILLIDCDTQRNSWLFYFGSKANTPLELKEYSDRLSILWNPERQPIKRIADTATYDHIILDMSTPLEYTVKVIVDNHPDIVLIPVSTHPYAIDGLDDTLPVISKLEELAGTPKVVIVPLGAVKSEINQKINDISSVPSNYKLHRRMRNVQKKMDLALKEKKPIWAYPEYEDLRDYFQSLLV